MAKEKIGFIGLGIMGRPMAKNLLKAGYPLWVYDHGQAKIQELVQLGATGAASSKEVAGNSEVIITMLPDSPQVEDAVFGKEGVVEGILAGSIFIDMSSINPLVSKRIAAGLAEKGVEMLDAPVSGGEPGAVQGTLAIMAGGKEEVFTGCLDIFKAMGKSIVRVGETGAGNFAKLVNQIIVAINIEAISEGLVLGAKAGLDPEMLFAAIRGGLAGSNVLNAKAPMIFDGNFKPGFRIRLHHKDLNNALMTARELGVALPVTSLVQQMLVALINDGKGDNDHSAIATFLEGLSKMEIRKRRTS